MRESPDELRDLLQRASDAIVQRRLQDAEALLTRIIEVLGAVHGPAGPQYRAALAVLRLIREQLGDMLGAGINVDDASEEEQLERSRFSYSREQRGLYLELIDAFAAAAKAANLRELARRILMVGLDLREGEAYAEALTALGDLAVAAGHYSQAHGISADLRDLSSRRWDPPALALRGRAWTGSHEHALGIAALREALVATDAGDASTWRSEAILALYEAALEVGDHDEAIHCHERLAALGDARGTSRREIAARAAETTDPERAVALYEEILTPTGPTDLRSSTLLRVAPRQIRLLTARGDLQRAYKLAEGVYHLFKDLRGDLHPSLSDFEELAAALELALRNPDNALGALAGATNRDTREAPRQLTVGSSGQRTRVLVRARRRTEAAVAIVVERGGPSEAIGGVHALVTRQKGLHTDIQAGALAEFERAAETSERVRALAEQLRKLRATLADEALEQALADAPSTSTLAGLVEEKEATEYELSARVGVMGGLMTQPNPANVLMTIPEQSAYLDYYAYTPLAIPGGPPPARRYCAFVLRAREMRFHVVDLGDADEIDELVRAFRRTILGRGDPGRDMLLAPVPAGGAASPAQAAASGQRLRERVFDPLLATIGELRRLVIAPDAALFTVPFDCLPARTGGHLIDEYTISYVSSSRSVMYFDSGVTHGAAGDTAPGRPPLVMGAPAYGAGTRFGALGGTQAEVAAVAQKLGVEPLVGDAASKDALLGAQQPLILHLATHGFFVEDAATADVLDDLPQLRTGMALAGANSPTLDGIVTGEEVLSLDLRGTALAVLSACETGLGEPQHGEGLASLARAFQAAGVDTVIAGLWKVPDRETTELMASFYEQLTPPVGCAEALRNAKLDVRRTHPDPYDWGAFACIGRWGSIATDNWTRP